MAENPFTQTETVRVDRALVAQSEPEVISGANWFWWIAGLSVVNRKRGSIPDHRVIDRAVQRDCGVMGREMVLSAVLEC